MSRKPPIVLASIGLALLGWSGPASAHAQGVVLNEVNCEGTDWVELVNTGTAAAEVGGWVLTDDPLERDPPRADHRHLLDAGTRIAPLASLVMERGAGGFPFGISCSDDTIRLGDAAGASVDSVVLEPPDPETDTWGRYPGGNGPWMQTSPTPGEPNEPSSAVPPADPAAWLFDPGEVVEIGLEIPAASREALAADPDEYQDGTFSLNAPGGTYGPLDVGVRLKGSASFRTLDGKSAFKLAFDDRFLGLRRLTLNNMVQDPSMLHEALAFEVFREAGLAAPRVGYAYVRVDGADYGLYSNVETPDRVMLPRWFDSTTHLYEGNPGADVTPELADRYEVDEGNEEERSDLDALIDAAGSSGQFSARMDPVADLGQMATVWAIQKYLGQWDGYAAAAGYGPNNYYLHSDASGRFRMLPWGLDQTFDAHLPFIGNRGVLYTGCLTDLPCAAAYRARVFALPGLIAGLGLDAKAESIAANLAPWQALDPRREQTLSEIAVGVAETRRFIAERPADLLDPEVWRPPPRSAGPVPVAELDRVAPQTRITDGPGAVVRGVERRRAVRFAFTASEADVRFECRLDDAAFAGCESPARTRARGGRHRFRVRAIDAAGNADPTPARRLWRVRR